MHCPFSLVEAVATLLPPPLKRGAAASSLPTSVCHAHLLPPLLAALLHSTTVLPKSTTNRGVFGPAAPPSPPPVTRPPWRAQRGWRLLMTHVDKPHTTMVVVSCFLDVPGIWWTATGTQRFGMGWCPPTGARFSQGVPFGIGYLVRTALVAMGLYSSHFISGASRVIRYNVLFLTNRYNIVHHFSVKKFTSRCLSLLTFTARYYLQHIFNFYSGLVRCTCDTHVFQRNLKILVDPSTCHSYNIIYYFFCKYSIILLHYLHPWRKKFSILNNISSLTTPSLQQFIA
jgi:hypothetical protein